MTGGGSSKPKVFPQIVEPLDPTPTPVMTEEVIGAKSAVKRKAKKKGRGANILAGRMMQGRQILNTGKFQLGA